MARPSFKTIRGYGSSLSKNSRLSASNTLYKDSPHWGTRTNGVKFQVRTIRLRLQILAVFRTGPPPRIGEWKGVSCHANRIVWPSASSMGVP